MVANLGCRGSGPQGREHGRVGRCEAARPARLRSAAGLLPRLDAGGRRRRGAQQVSSGGVSRRHDSPARAVRKAAGSRPPPPNSEEREMSDSANKHGILVAVDGSPESDAAVRWAAHEAEMRDVPITLMHVVM